jgi:glutamate-5-semialdehyde dehydrogenase
VDRLRLTPRVVETVAQGCEQLAAMPDPVGEITGVKRRPSGISVGRMRVPHGRLRHDLREPPQRHDRGGLAGHQERQRLHPARRLRGACTPTSRCGVCVRAALAEAAACRPTRVQLVETTDRAAVGAPASRCPSTWT